MTDFQNHCDVDCCSVYRIEHLISKLGPFQHGGQIVEVVNKGVNGIRSVMDDIDDIPDVKNILIKNPATLFAFNSKDKCIRFIRDFSILQKYGFSLVEYSNVQPLFISSDGQVLFLYTVGETIRKDISHTIPKNLKNIRIKR